jgi:hypothetical protein
MRASARLSARPLSDLDLSIYRQVLPEKSFLLDALRLVDWKSFEDELQRYYSSNPAGQPEYPPLILLKMEFLRHYYGLSQAKCVERCRCDLLFKFFLQLPVAAGIVDQSMLTIFRKRLGPEGFLSIFDRLVSQARGHGVIKDRLRLKDATHIVGDVAIPSALGLFAQLRDRMLRVVECFDPSAAATFREDMATVRAESEGQDNSLRLLQRVALVEDILEWMKRAPEEPQETGKTAEDLRAAKRWAQLQSTIALAEKILGDLDDPSAGDKVRSVVDSDLRRGKHGEFYDGYLFDALLDPDSEMFTAIDVLPANGDEAANAIRLIEQEEQAHGNDIEQLSIDGIGFNGEVLHQLEDPDNLAVEVFTPPKDFSSTKGFPASKFEMTEDGKLRCPAGHVSGRGSRKKDKPNNTFFRFPRAACSTCPLQPECYPTMSETPKSGRRVRASCSYEVPRCSYP